MIPYGELWVLSVSSLLSGVAPGDWQEAVPLADAMATYLLEQVGIPKPGGVHPTVDAEHEAHLLNVMPGIDLDEEARLHKARTQARKPKR
jgi:hypothetical protein